MVSKWLYVELIVWDVIRVDKSNKTLLKPYWNKDSVCGL